MLFYHRRLPPFGLLATILSLPCPTPHAAIRWDQRGQVVRKLSPAGYCLPPTAQLPKTERARSRRAALLLFQYVTEPAHFPHIYRKTLECKGLATNRFFAFGHVNWHRYLKCQNDLRPVIRARCAESRNQAIFTDKIICSSPLAATHPLTVLSWPRAQPQFVQACLPDGHKPQFLFPP